MPAKKSDQHLRRLITQMVTLSAADMRDILAQLDIEDRHRVQGLLEEFDGGSTADQGEFLVNAISPWLSQCASTVDGSSLTPHAQNALQRAAARLFPVSERVDHEKLSRQSLMQKTVSFFSRASST